MRNIGIIARKEIQEGLRNRWVLATTLLLAARSRSLATTGLTCRKSLSSAMLRRCEQCWPTLTHNLTSSLACLLASRHTLVVVLGL